MWVRVLTIAVTVTVCATLPIVTHPLEAEVGIPEFSVTPPQTSSRCFSLPKGKRHTSRDCLIAFLATLQGRLLASLPVIQGNKANERMLETRQGTIRELLTEIANRVAQQPAANPLSASFVDEALLMADILSDKEHVFGTLYHDFVDRGAQTETVIAQLSYDTDNPTGLPTYSSGELAPTFSGDGHDGDFDHLQGVGTFRELLNPHNCEPGDERPECLQSMPIEDPRFDRFEHWEERVPRDYVHQPLEEAMASLAKQEQDQAQKNQPPAKVAPPATQGAAHTKGEHVLLTTTAPKIVQ